MKRLKPEEMKKLFATLIPLAAIFVVSFTTHQRPIPIGSELPLADRKMKDISGKEVAFQDALGENGLLVMFSCNTCPYVIKNQERTRSIAEHAANQGIGVVLVNSNEAQRGDEDSFEAMQQYAKAQGYKWYYVVDENSVAADAFSASRTPECFLFNKDKKLVYHGAIDDNPSDASNVTREHLKMAMDEMKTGKEVSTKESRSIGCGIKRL